MKSKILVVVAHPDDEILGCGATMALHKQRGDLVHVLIMAEGLTSRSEKRNRGTYANDLSKLSASARKASNIVGVKSLTLNDFPDNRMDSVDLLDIIKVVEKNIEKIKPDVVYTHHAGDLNIDHRLTHQAVVTACRPMPASHIKTLLFFEVPSSTDYQPHSSSIPFIPNWYVDVTKTIELKIKALKSYDSEMKRWPHSRSYEAIRHLAHWRGATIGKVAAEAFVLGRNIAPSLV